jgi:hypothetical protein
MKRVLIAAVIAMSFASPSFAEKLTLTVSGTLTSGDDNTGVFGTSTDLTGESVSVQFFIDTSLGTRTETGNTLQYIGGFFYPAGTPVTSGAITVGGVTHVVGFPIFGELYEALGSATTTDDIEAQVSQLSENQIGPVLHFGSISILSEPLSNGQVTPRRFEMPFTYTPAADTGTGTSRSLHANPH